MTERPLSVRPDATHPQGQPLADDPQRAGDPSPPRRRDRRFLGAAAAAAALTLGGLGWLFAGEGAAPAPPVNLADLPKVDGTLNVVEADRLVMTAFEPVDGSDQVTFTIPEQYRKNFDMAHLRSHSSVGIPTRVYYIDRDGVRLAVYKGDAPANSTSSEQGTGDQ